MRLGAHGLNSYKRHTDLTHRTGVVVRYMRISKAFIVQVRIIVKIAVFRSHTIIIFAFSKIRKVIWSIFIEVKRKFCLSRNVTADDFGQYRLEYFPVQGTVHSNVSLEENIVHKLHRRALATAVPVGVSVLILSSIIFGILNKAYALLFFKKHFGPYEKGIFN